MSLTLETTLASLHLSSLNKSLMILHLVQHTMESKNSCTQIAKISWITLHYTNFTPVANHHHIETCIINQQPGLITATSIPESLETSAGSPSYNLCTQELQKADLTVLSQILSVYCMCIKYVTGLSPHQYICSNSINNTSTL